ncbi:hypothetical protein [Planctomyces sp. SH-PL14]|uniref:hypothetical protein n=1 Tax=Planctomyces sp. SH-PL14 TaxID=1632864 RepID=UPI00078B596B|nr:hypothetical protein [Planctomyces sp. SH-PL14]AMV16598.1 hypothetical protein VT03_01830 [Planctomyces sp. SH-PL14]
MAIANLVLTAKLSADITKSLTDGSVAKLAYDKGLFNDLPADADLLYTNGYSIATASSQSLDLSASLADAVGNSCVFAKVYAVFVKNLATATGRNIQIGGDSNHVPLFGAPADFLTVGPKGVLLVCNCLDGWTVTAGTGDILKIANSAGGQTIPVAVAVLGKAAA